MQNAVDGMYMYRSIKTKPGHQKNTHKKKWNVMNTAPGVLAEVKNKMC